MMLALDVLSAAVDHECSCGGCGPNSGCAACRVWHRAKSELRKVDRAAEKAIAERDEARAEVERLRNKKCVHDLALEFLEDDDE